MAKTTKGFKNWKTFVILTQRFRTRVALYTCYCDSEGYVMYGKYYILLDQDLFAKAVQSLIRGGGGQSGWSLFVNL